MDIVGSLNCESEKVGRNNTVDFNVADRCRWLSLSLLKHWLYFGVMYSFVRSGHCLLCVLPWADVKWLCFVYQNLAHLNWAHSRHLPVVLLLASWHQLQLSQQMWWRQDFSYFHTSIIILAVLSFLSSR